MSAPSWIQMMVIISLWVHSLSQDTSGQATGNSVYSERTTCEVLQVIVDLQQRFIRQDEIIDQLSTRVDALECENNALNEQIRALEACPVGYKWPGSGCFRVLNVQGITYQEAERMCAVDGGCLVSINNASKSLLLVNYLQWWQAQYGATLTYARIGLNDIETEGDHRWALNNESVEWDNWCPNEPDNRGEGEGCVNAYIRGRNLCWYDLRCDSGEPAAICEIPQ